MVNATLHIPTTCSDPLLKIDFISHPIPPTSSINSSGSPTWNQNSKTNFGSLAFHTAAPLIWNGLPADVWSSPSIQTFKKMLKTYYFCSLPPMSRAIPIPAPQIRVDWAHPEFQTCHYDLGWCSKSSLLLYIIIPALKHIKTCQNSMLWIPPWHLSEVRLQINGINFLKKINWR